MSNMSSENRKSISIMENSPPVITSTCCVGLHCCSQADDSQTAKIHRVESVMNMLKQIQDEMAKIKNDLTAEE